MLKHINFTNLKKSEIHYVEIMDQTWKRLTPTIYEHPSQKSWTSWIWDQYLPENMKWKFGKLSRPRNHKTRKPENHNIRQP